MTALAPLGQFTPHMENLPAERGAVDIKAFTELSVSRQRSADITITTAEGDRVTLTSRSEGEAYLSAYSQRGTFDEESTQMTVRSFSYSTSRESSISVEGNLSKQELREVRKAIRQIDGIMRAVLAGELDNALKRILKLEKLASISTLDASVQFSQSNSVTKTAQMEEKTAPIEMEEHPKPMPNVITINDVNKLIGRMMHIVRHSRIEPEKLIKPVDRMFSRYYKEISDDGLQGIPKLKLAKLIRSRIAGIP